MKKTTTVLTALITSSVLLLSACGTSTQPSPNKSSETPGNISPTPSPVEATPVTLLIEDLPSEPDTEYNDEGYKLFIGDGNMFYGTSGSGSCSPIVRDAEYLEEANVVTLKFNDYSESSCTDDLGYFNQKISLPEGGVIPADVEVKTVLIELNSDETPSTPATVSEK